MMPETPCYELLHFSILLLLHVCVKLLYYKQQMLKIACAFLLFKTEIMQKTVKNEANKITEK